MGPSGLTRSYGLATTENIGEPHPDAVGITDDLIRAVVDEFYRRARRDDQLGPIFETYVASWDEHLARMTDFWSSALLRTGRYAGQPVAQHMRIVGLRGAHFTRWLDLFEETVLDLCTAPHAEAFLSRARRMRHGISKVLGLDADSQAILGALLARAERSGPPPGDV